MKLSHKLAIGVVASLSLGVAAASVYAHPGQMGGGMGPHMQGGMQHGMQGGTRHGAGQQLMTPEERTAFREKMHNAKTPEERQQIVAANRAEMQKRAQEKGITLHQGHGPRSGATTQTPQSTE